MNVGRLTNLIELYCRGVDPLLSANHELVRDIMNMKLKEFAARTGIIESKSSITSVANQQEYELPADKTHVKYVFYDDYKAKKINFIQSKELAGKTTR